MISLLKILAWLPLGVMYVISDVVAALLYHVVRYRRQVVRTNLRACFPEKSKAEIRKIAHRFYRNFTDYIFETVKLLHISDKEILRRMTFNNVELMDRYLAEGRNVVVYFSHTGNWEWATSVRLHSSLRDDSSVVFGQIYRPLRNKRMDALMLRIRDRFHTLCIPKATALRQFVNFRRDGKVWVVGFMSDQKPSHGDPTRIVSFFDRPTAVITGTETLARRTQAAVVYWDISKPSRGHYHIDVVPMTDNAETTKDGSLTARYFSLLQKTLEKDPALWLWSHKRWKNSPLSWDDVDPKTIIDS